MNFVTPTFCLAAGGPWYCLMGGVVMQKVIIQHLTAMEWLACSSTEEGDHILRIACIFWEVFTVPHKIRIFELHLPPIASQTTWKLSEQI